MEGYGASGEERMREARVEVEACHARMASRVQAAKVLSALLPWMNFVFISACCVFGRPGSPDDSRVLLARIARRYVQATGRER